MPISRQLIRYLLLLPLAVWLSGCGLGPTNPLEAGDDLQGYESVFIRSVRIHSGGQAAANNIPLQKKLHDWEVYSRARLEDYFQAGHYQLLDNAELLEGAEHSGITALAVELDVNIHYDERLLRWAIGLATAPQSAAQHEDSVSAAQQSGMYSILTLRDINNGEVVLRLYANDDMNDGGDIDDLLERNLESLIEQHRQQSAR